MSSEIHVFPQIHVYAFSFRRTAGLLNLLLSVRKCLPNAPVTVVDDRSSNIAMRLLLRNLKRRGHEVWSGEHREGVAEGPHGGLYAGIHRALTSACECRCRYKLFLQDDMQLVRKFGRRDIEYIDKLFQAEDASPFMRISFFPVKPVAVELIGSGYRITDKNGRYYCYLDTALVNTSQIRTIPHELKSEEEFNDYFAAQFRYAPVSAYPFAAFVPNPAVYRFRSVRTRSRFRIYRPFQLMSEKQTIQFFGRDAKQMLPYSDDWLLPLIGRRLRASSQENFH